MTEAVDSGTLAEGPFRYEAFISYKHASSRTFSEAFEAALKVYAKPIFRPPLRIFRDEKHLAPGVDLPKLIRDALEQSRYLIVLASEGAANSPWVADEIDYFCRVLKRADRLIIVLTEEGLFTDSVTKTIDWSRTTVLPPVLRDHLTVVPLYIDLAWARTKQDLTIANPTFKQAINATVARLRGIDPNEMLGEEIRQHRRTLGIRNTAIGLLAALTLISVGAFSVAREQRARAESRLADNYEEQARRELIAGYPARARAYLEAIKDAAPDLQGPDAALLLDAALRGRGTTARLMQEHNGPIIAADVSPDGSSIVTGSVDESFALWERSGGLKERMESPLVVQQRNRILQKQLKQVMGEDEEQRRRDAIQWLLSSMKPKTEEAHVPQRAGAVLLTRFSPTGDRLLTTSANGVAELWSVERDGRARTLGVLEPMPVLGMTAAFSPDGQTVAVPTFQLLPDADGNRPAHVTPDNILTFISLWSARDGHFLAQSELAHTPVVIDVDFDSTGKRFASVGKDDTIALWDLEGRMLTSFSTTELPETRGQKDNEGPHITAIRFGVGDALLITGLFSAWIHHFDTGRVSRFTPPPRDNGVAFPDTIEAALWTPGKDAVLLVHGKRCSLWDAETGALLRTYDSAGEALTQAVFSGDGALLAAGDQRGSAHLWEVKSGRLLSVLEGHTTVGLSALHFVPEGLGGRPTRLLTASRDGTARLWRLVDELTGAGLPGDVHQSATPSPTGARMASSDGTTVVLRAFHSRESGVTLDESSGSWTEFLWSPDETALFGMRPDGEGGRLVAAWNTSTGQRLGAKSGEDIKGMALSLDGKRLLTWTAQRELQMRDAESLEVLNRVVAAQEGTIEWAGFGAAGTVVVATESHPEDKLWESTKRVLLWTERLEKVSAFEADAIGDGPALTADGRMLAIPKGKEASKAPTDQARLGTMLRHEDDLATLQEGLNWEKQVREHEAARHRTQSNSTLLIDVVSGSVLGLLSNPRGIGQGAVFSHDGSKLFTWDSETAGIVWSVSARAPVAYVDHRKRILQAAFTSSANAVMTTSIELSGVRIFSARTGALLREIDELERPSLLGCAPAGLNCLVWARSGLHHFEAALDEAGSPGSVPPQFAWKVGEGRLVPQETGLSDYDQPFIQTAKRHAEEHVEAINRPIREAQARAAGVVGASLLLLLFVILYVAAERREPRRASASPPKDFPSDFKP